MLPDWFLGMSAVLSFPSSEFTGGNGKHSGPMWLDSLVGLIYLLLVPFIWKGWTFSIYPTWINPNSMIQRIRTLHHQSPFQKSLTVWVWPSPNNNHHQDSYNFMGDPNLNLHLPLESWQGTTPISHLYKKCSRNPANCCISFHEDPTKLTTGYGSLSQHRRRRFRGKCSNPNKGVAP